MCTHTQGRPCKDTGSILTSQGQRSREKSAFLYLGLKLPASRTVRKFLLLKTPHLDIL
jgi:hypothetical protein